MRERSTPRLPFGRRKKLYASRNQSPVGRIYVGHPQRDGGVAPDECRDFGIVRRKALDRKTAGTSAELRPTKLVSTALERHAESPRVELDSLAEIAHEETNDCELVGLVQGSLPPPNRLLRGTPTLLFAVRGSRSKSAASISRARSAGKLVFISFQQILPDGKLTQSAALLAVVFRSASVARPNAYIE